MRRLLLYVMLIGVALFTAQCKKEGSTAPEDRVASKKVTLTNAQWGSSVTTHWSAPAKGLL